MDSSILTRHFERMGARFVMGVGVPRRWRNLADFTLDVQRERKGERFVLSLWNAEDYSFEIADSRPKERHLLLMARNERTGEKQKFLCGHDEREWFVAAIPEAEPASTVREAKEALKPTVVRTLQNHKHIKTKDRGLRRNDAYIRQGEWFFIPTPDMEIGNRALLHNEPLSRGVGSKPHIMETCVRWGGELVYVCWRHPNGLPFPEYEALLDANPKAKNWGWSAMRRDMEVYARGRVSHPDHKTIVLKGWHRVMMNTESQAKAMAFVAFLD